VESLRKKMQKLTEEANLALTPIPHSESVEALKLFVSATLEDLSF